MRVGVFGAGQLGRMLGEAGGRLGLSFRFLDPAAEVSARRTGEHLMGEYDDPVALTSFADGIDVVTYEFENVPVDAVRVLEETHHVAPSSEALRVAQDRMLEKSHARDLGIPVPKFHAVESELEFDTATRSVGVPSVLKTRRFGYDGKGQRIIRSAEDAAGAFRDLRGSKLILEEFIAFQRELSLIAVRSRKGDFLAWPLVENTHRDGILRLSVAPAGRVDRHLQARAEEYIRSIMGALGYIGVLAVEFFLKDNQLYFNEMAPRVHNSGHWTIEGAETSQFENHLRALADLPLGDTAARGHSAMINLIGSIERMDEILRIPDVHLHDYEKAPREGRKVGHLTVVRRTREELNAVLREINGHLTVNKLPDRA